MLGYHPQVILAGRRINDSMGKFIAEQAVKQMVAAGNPIKDSLAIILGLTFKENCADLRNSKVIDVIRELKATASRSWLPIRWRMPAKLRENMVWRSSPWDALPRANIIVAAVPHDAFLAMPVAKIVEKFAGQQGVFVDVKAAFDARQSQARRARSLATLGAAHEDIWLPARRVSSACIPPSSCWRAAMRWSGWTISTTITMSSEAGAARAPRGTRRVSPS